MGTWGVRRAGGSRYIPGMCCCETVLRCGTSAARAFGCAAPPRMPAGGGGARFLCGSDLRGKAGPGRAPHGDGGARAERDAAAPPAAAGGLAGGAQGGALALPRLPGGGGRGKLGCAAHVPVSGGRGRAPGGEEPFALFHRYARPRAAGRARGSGLPQLGGAAGPLRRSATATAGYGARGGAGGASAFLEADRSGRACDFGRCRHETAALEPKPSQ